MRYGLMEESFLSLFICLGNFIKKKTSIALQLHVFVLPKPYVDLHDKILTHMFLVVALSFFKLCDPSEMSFVLVWSRSRALHQLNFYSGSQLCHSIHLQNKTPCLMISLSGISQMRHGLSKRKWWHAQEAWPKKMKKKIRHMKLQKKDIQ